MWFFKDSSTVTGSRYDLVSMWSNSGSFKVWIEDNDNIIYNAHRKDGDASWTNTKSSGVKPKVPLDRWTHIGIVLTGSKE